MSKFKQGHEVYWEGYEGEKHFRVVSKVEDHKVWFTNGYWEHEENLFFVDQPLPEVPKEVRYECAYCLGRDYLTVQKTLPDDEIFLQLRIKDGSKFSRLNLTAESALELSADLLRMALQIKRDSEESDE